MRLIPNALIPLFLFPLVIGVRDSTDRSQEGNHNVLLHEAVRTLLGFKETPERTRMLPYNTNNLGKEAPKYMMDLYSRFRNTQISKGHLSGNTVRSIHAEIADVNGEPMFVFNLSSVEPGETLLSAEIHLFKRKPKKHWHKKRDLELLMYEIAPHYMTENGKITMRAESYGWQWYDVTNSALSCLAARRETPHLFALNFQVEKQNGKVKTIAIKKFIRRHSMPFLIIYSNDTQNIHLDQLDSLAERLNKEKLQQKKHISNKISSDLPVSSDKATESRTLENNNSVKKNSKTGQVITRRRRSIFNNEIPEDPVDYKGFGKRFNIPQTHPGILQTRRESRHKLTDPRLIPYPDNTDGRSGRRRNRKNRKNKRRKNKNRKKNRNKLVFPKEWNSFHENEATAENSGHLCGKRKLILDFADIGWEDWIIAPKSFEAHYCAGPCPFPLTKKLRPSNHATIQSMVHAIGIHADVPAPCCVPESMSSVTLLYFDENRNVVLKNYPNMSVNSCACR